MTCTQCNGETYAICDKNGTVLCTKCDGTGLLRKCRYRHCTDGVKRGGYRQYCNMTCEMSEAQAMAADFDKIVRGVTVTRPASCRKISW